MAPPTSAIDGLTVTISSTATAPSAARQVARECEALGVQALIFRANVAEDAQCRAMAEARPRLAALRKGCPLASPTSTRAV